MSEQPDQQPSEGVNDQIVLCIDCHSYNCDSGGACNKLIDPVTGEREENDCRWMRMQGPCGQEAKLFTPAEEWKKNLSRERYEESKRPITFKEDIQRTGCVVVPFLVIAVIMWIMWMIT